MDEIKVTDKEAFQIQIKNIDYNLKGLIRIESQYEKFDREQLEIVLLDLIVGYKGVLGGLKADFLARLK